ncbi:MAG: V-type ATPase 116kDa subunit family protein [Hungatella sp.]
MIEKMKFLSITGPKSDIDRVIDQYLSKYEIHLENALSELKTVKDLRPYMEINPYKDIYQRSNEILSGLSEDTPPAPRKQVTLDEAAEIISSLSKELEDFTAQKSAFTAQIDTLQTSMDKIVPFEELDYDLSSILHFRYIKFRFGRIAHEYYNKFYRYVYDTIDTVLYKCHEDETYIWVVYFVPDSISDKVDAIYSSMHFEPFFLPDEYEGTPTEASHLLAEKIAAAQESVHQIDQKIAEALNAQKQDLLAANQKLASYSANFDVRKLAACTKQDINTFYILCGWMEESDANAFRNEIGSDDKTFCIVEDDHSNIISRPPTKLKNPGIFKPFEMFIQMYGLPAYNEIDPTILIGLTYSFLFGFMFGDMGQGLCLLIGGLLLYKTKKMNLAAVISCCGFFSTLFGFLFGSVFGFENIIDAAWLRPKEAMMQLPFIGNMNTVFVVAIALGMGIIILTMLLNIINSLRSHNTEKAYFDTNGVAGLVFYTGIVITVVLFTMGHALPATLVLIIMFVIPLLAIFFKEPLTAFIEKKSKIMPKAKAMFFVQGFFELFEVLLSYFSNTLSFVRVGAFAVSHAAMMEVVLMLAGAEAGGSPNWMVVILGNIFVCGMEGLIVGIQVLRLEYYELFSRFYRGTGRAFKPYGKA